MTDQDTLNDLAALCATYPDDMAAEIKRLRAECAHVYSEYDLVIAQRDQLVAALNLTMLGGNHLARVLIGRLGEGFAAQYPPNLDHEIALRKLGVTVEYDVWYCWAAIMAARAALEEKP